MKLKPCPFCGAKAKTEKHSLLFWRVRCTGCMTVQSEMVTSEQAAIACWNRREETAISSLS